MTRSSAWLRSCGPQERAAVEEELILVNRGVAEAVEAGYAHRGLPAEDVRQVACEALVKAGAKHIVTVIQDAATSVAA